MFAGHREGAVKPRLPFRLGSTSYVYPADILPNVQRLAPLVDDVELVLFEVDDGQNNLPSPDVIDELSMLAVEHDLTFTVHLPLDLRLASGDSSSSLEKARRVIYCTHPLNPWAYIVHLDGSEIVSNDDPAVLTGWRDRVVCSLELLGQEVDDLSLLAVENLESYDPGAFLPLLDRLPISLCLDVGHFVKSDSDPLLYLEAHLERARVVHLHGCRDGRDHRGLDLLPDGLLTDLFVLLESSGYAGVLTLEVFTQRHFFPGRELILSLMEGR
jgi:sugar phosphate isomerase/epimerase